MFELQKLIRKNIRDLQPYRSARDEFSGKADIYLDANENPFGEFNRYPDPYQSGLKARIAEIKGHDESQIFVGNGSDEIIDLCYRIFCNPGMDKALTFSPGYGMYKVSAKINDVELVEIPLDSSFEIPLGRVEEDLKDASIRIIFICSPNNPSGNKFNSATILKILSQFNGLVVIDEAYQEFADSPSYLSELKNFPNLIVMQTLSKAWGMAGLRLGIAFASGEIIELLNKVKPPYNVSEANQKEALRLLDEPELFHERIRIIKEERNRLRKELHKSEMVKYIYPTEANFLLVEVTDAEALYNALKEKGIIVRNRHNQVKNTLRITVGTPEENDALLNTLKL